MVDALRRSTGSHTLSEFDMAGNRAQGERIAAGLRGRSVILVALGVLAAQVARAALPEAPLVFCMVPDPVQAGLADVPRVAGVAASVPLKNQLAAFRLVNPRGVRIGLLHGVDSAGAIDEGAEGRPAGAGGHRARLIASERASPRPCATCGAAGGGRAVDPPDPVDGRATRRFVIAERSGRRPSTPRRTS